MNKNSNNGKTLQVLPLSTYKQPQVTLEDYPRINVLFSHPPILFEVLQNIQPHLESFPLKEQLVIDTMFNLAQVFGTLRPSHEYIARQSKTDKSTVKRALKRARRIGLIDWKRFNRSSNEYFIAPWAQTLPFRQRFSYLFPALLMFASYTIYTPRVLCTGSSWRALRPLNDLLYNKENTLKGMDISLRDNNPLRYPDYFGILDPDVVLDPPTNRLMIENRECGDGQLCQTCRNDKKERKREMEMHEASIPSYVESIKVLSLTNRGKAELSQYHQEAIEFACKQIIKREVDNPFTYFSKICKNYSLEHNLPINFALFKNLSIKLGIGQSDPHLVEGTGINKPSLRNLAHTERGGKSVVNYPVWNPPADMFVYDELSDPEKLKYLFTEAQAVYDLQACSPCKELKKPCPQSAVNPFKDALVDLQKQIYSTTGYQANPLNWHISNRLFDAFTLRKCIPPKVELISTIDPMRISAPTPTPQDHNLLI